MLLQATAMLWLVIYIKKMFYQYSYLVLYIVASNEHLMGSQAQADYLLGDRGWWTSGSVVTASAAAACCSAVVFRLKYVVSLGMLSLSSSSLLSFSDFCFLFAWPLSFFLYISATGENRKKCTKSPKQQLVKTYSVSCPVR